MAATPPQPEWILSESPVIMAWTSTMTEPQ